MGVSCQARNYSIMILISAALVSIIDLPFAEARTINCRKYVHIPQCRGVAAKRNGFDSNGDRYVEVEESAVYDPENLGSPQVVLNLNKFLGDLIRKARLENLGSELSEDNYVKANK